MGSDTEGVVRLSERRHIKCPGSPYRPTAGCDLAPVYALVGTIMPEAVSEPMTIAMAACSVHLVSVKSFFKAQVLPMWPISIQALDTYLAIHGDRDIFELRERAG
jgi:hypothetical protein